MAAAAGDADSASSGIYPCAEACPKYMYRDYAREVVFKKILCRSDIQDAGSYRLYIPKAHAARFCSPANGSEVITFSDVEMKPWPMHFCTSGGKTFLKRGWSNFVRKKQLREGDTITLYEVRCGQSTRFFMIAVTYKDRLQILGAPIN